MRFHSMRSRLKPWTTVLKFAWAAPCSILGIFLALMPLALGGRIKWLNGAVEITYRDTLLQCRPPLNRLPFNAIVFGHVILAVTEEELRQIRSHERIHVAQYERWGLFFFLAYGLSSLWQLARGRDPYWDNYFEIDARLRAHEQH